MGIAASPGPFWAYSSGPQTKENRWICEAPMQDRQGSGVAVSHQNAARDAHASRALPEITTGHSRPTQDSGHTDINQHKAPGPGFTETPVRLPCHRHDT